MGSSATAYLGYGFMVGSDELWEKLVEEGEEICDYLDSLELPEGVEYLISEDTSYSYGDGPVFFFSKTYEVDYYAGKFINDMDAFGDRGEMVRLAEKLGFPDAKIGWWLTASFG